jgi:hypothetical protein
MEENWETTKSAEVPSAKAERPTDEVFADVNRRESELRATGLSEDVARNMAQVQYQVENWWPAAWGNELQVQIYGDFQAPDCDLEYPSLGITVKAGRLEKTVLGSAAGCVVFARVKVRERSFVEVLDAVTRINTLLGIWTIIDWGNRSFGWWCHVIARNMGGMCGPINLEGVERAIQGLDALPAEVRHKVRAALYWIREPRRLNSEGFKDDTLRVYAGYWNAFECLVEAVCFIKPPTKMKKQDKLDGIAKYLADHDGKLDIASLTECYRSFVDPGFVSKASHALRVCYGDRAEGYISECFRAKPDENRLYAIRNSINHGDINYEDLQEVSRVDGRSYRLFLIVFGMLGRLIPFSCPLDPGLQV